KEALMFSPGRSVLVSLAVLLVALAAPALAADTASVEGRINLKGEPLAEGKIHFQPDRGKAVVVEVKDGAFSTPAVPVGVVGVGITGKGVPPQYAPKHTALRATISK